MGGLIAATPDTAPFAAEEAQKRLGRLAMQIGRTARFCDASAVHDLRVAIRRFSQTLVVLKPCFRLQEVKAIRRTLRKLMTLAGDVRNCDITLKLLAEPALPAVELAEEIGTRRQDAQRLLAAALKRWLRRQTSARWRSALEIVGECGALEDLARHTLRAAAKRYLRRGKIAAKELASAAELHQLRIAAKKLRYTLELLAPLSEGALGGALQQVTGVQSQLGTINDYQTVRSMLGEYKGGEGIETRLRRRQRRKTAEFRRDWELIVTAETGHRVAELLEELRSVPKVRRKPMARSLTSARVPEKSRARA